MRVAGCLVRHSKLSVIEMEDFIERLCIDNNDREIKIEKIKLDVLNKDTITKNLHLE